MHRLHQALLNLAGAYYLSRPTQLQVCHWVAATQNSMLNLAKRTAQQHDSCTYAVLENTSQDKGLS